MIQEKLRNLRKRKNISQQEMAKIIGTDTSNYSRKERGEVRIYIDEWEKMARALDVTIEDIKNEGEEVSDSYSHSNITEQSGNGLNFYHVPDIFIETQRKYINKLEKEVESLKAENERLRSEAR